MDSGTSTHDVYSEMAQLVGDDNAKKLAAYFGGQYIYFPTRGALDRDRRNQEIRQAFNGRNIRDLARQFRLSEQRVRDILKEGKGRQRFTNYA